MRVLAPIGLRAGNLIVLAVALIPALAQAGEARVSVRDGLVTATFDAVAAPDALEAVRRATGVEIIVPPSIQQRHLTLTVEQVPFERFLRRLFDALDLGGFALVYEENGGASRIIVADKGRADQAAPAAMPPTARPPTAVIRGGEGERASVAFLVVPPTESESMRLGMPGQLIVVESAPIAMVKAGQCGGTSDDYPVQNVIVMDGTQTHVTSIIVCAAQGLIPGQRLTLNSARVGTDAPPTGSGRYVRLTATLL